MITKFKIFENDDSQIFLEYWRIPTSSPKLEIALEKLKEKGCDIKKDNIKLKSNKKYIYIVRKTKFEEPFIFYTDWYIAHLLNLIKTYNNKFMGDIKISKNDILEYNMKENIKKYNL